MKKFIIKTTVISLATIMFCAIVCFIMPTTPRAAHSLLFAEFQKDSLLQHEQSPRIIFIGGSNISFGLNSQIVKDSLHLNPINTAIHAGIGLKYMLDHTTQFIKEGDIIVLIPEYEHFFNDYDKGSGELLRMSLDVDKSKLKLLNCRQILNCLPHVGNVIKARLNPMDYFYNVETDSTNVYLVNSFNKYGDTYVHWHLQGKKITAYGILNEKAYNPKVMNGIKDFELKINQKGARVYISYPSYQDVSFCKSINAIKKVETEYQKNGLIILGTPERYMMVDSLMFNSRYHLNKKGLDYRTQLFIEDFKSKLDSWQVK